MPTEPIDDVLTRLGGVNSELYDPVTNPGGLDEGHEEVFPQALHDVAAATAFVAERATAVAASEIAPQDQQRPPQSPLSRQNRRRLPQPPLPPRRLLPLLPLL